MSGFQGRSGPSRHWPRPPGTGEPRAGPWLYGFPPGFPRPQAYGPRHPNAWHAPRWEKRTAWRYPNPGNNLGVWSGNNFVNQNQLRWDGGTSFIPPYQFGNDRLETSFENNCVNGDVNDAESVSSSVHSEAVSEDGGGDGKGERELGSGPSSGPSASGQWSGPRSRGQGRKGHNHRWEAGHRDSYRDHRDGNHRDGSHREHWDEGHRDCARRESGQRHSSPSPTPHPSPTLGGKPSGSRKPSASTSTKVGPENVQGSPAASSNQKQNSLENARDRQINKAADKLKKYLEDCNEGKKEVLESLLSKADKKEKHESSRHPVERNAFDPELQLTQKDLLDIGRIKPHVVESSPTPPTNHEREATEVIDLLDEDEAHDVTDQNWSEQVKPAEVKHLSSSPEVGVNSHMANDEPEVHGQFCKVPDPVSGEVNTRSENTADKQRQGSLALSVSEKPGPAEVVNGEVPVSVNKTSAQSPRPRVSSSPPKNPLTSTPAPTSTPPRPVFVPNLVPSRSRHTSESVSTSPNSGQKHCIEVGSQEETEQPTKRAKRSRSASSNCEGPDTNARRRSFAGILASGQNGTSSRSMDEIKQQLLKMNLKDMVTNPSVSRRAELVMQQLMKEHSIAFNRQLRNLAEARMLGRSPAAKASAGDKALDTATDCAELSISDPLELDPDLAVDLAALPQEVIESLQSLLQLDMLDGDITVSGSAGDSLMGAIADKSGEIHNGDIGDMFSSGILSDIMEQDSLLGIEHDTKDLNLTVQADRQNKVLEHSDSQGDSESRISDINLDYVSGKIDYLVQKEIRKFKSSIAGSRGHEFSLKSVNVKQELFLPEPIENTEEDCRVAEEYATEHLKTEFPMDAIQEPKQDLPPVASEGVKCSDTSGELSSDAPQANKSPCSLANSQNKLGELAGKDAVKKGMEPESPGCLDSESYMDADSPLVDYGLCDGETVAEGLEEDQSGGYIVGDARQSPTYPTTEDDMSALDQCLSYPDGEEEELPASGPVEEEMATELGSYCQDEDMIQEDEVPDAVVDEDMSEPPPSGNPSGAVVLQENEIEMTEDLQAGSANCKETCDDTNRKMEDSASKQQVSVCGPVSEVSAPVCDRTARQCLPDSRSDSAVCVDQRSGSVSKVQSGEQLSEAAGCVEEATPSRTCVVAHTDAEEVAEVLEAAADSLPLPAAPYLACTGTSPLRDCLLDASTQTAPCSPPPAAAAVPPLSAELLELLLQQLRPAGAPATDLAPAEQPPQALQAPPPRPARQRPCTSSRGRSAPGCDNEAPMGAGTSTGRARPSRGSHPRPKRALAVSAVDLPHLVTDREDPSDETSADSCGPMDVGEMFREMLRVDKEMQRLLAYKMHLYRRLRQLNNDGGGAGGPKPPQPSDEEPSDFAEVAVGLSGCESSLSHSGLERAAPEQRSPPRDTDEAARCSASPTGGDGPAALEPAVPAAGGSPSPPALSFGGRVPAPQPKRSLAAEEEPSEPPALDCHRLSPDPELERSGASLLGDDDSCSNPGVCSVGPDGQRKRPQPPILQQDVMMSVQSPPMVRFPSDYCLSVCSAPTLHDVVGSQTSFESLLNMGMEEGTGADDTGAVGGGPGSHAPLASERTPFDACVVDEVIQSALSASPATKPGAAGSPHLIGVELSTSHEQLKLTDTSVVEAVLNTFALPDCTPPQLPPPPPPPPLEPEPEPQLQSQPQPQPVSPPSFPHQPEPVPIADSAPRPEPACSPSQVPRPESEPAQGELAVVRPEEGIRTNCAVRGRRRGRGRGSWLSAGRSRAPDEPSELAAAAAPVTAGPRGRGRGRLSPRTSPRSVSRLRPGGESPVSAALPVPPPLPAFGEEAPAPAATPAPAPAPAPAEAAEEVLTRRRGRQRLSSPLLREEAKGTSPVPKITRRKAAAAAAAAAQGCVDISSPSTAGSTPPLLSAAGSTPPLLTAPGATPPLLTAAAVTNTPPKVEDTPFSWGDYLDFPRTRRRTKLWGSGEYDMQDPTPNSSPRRKRRRPDDPAQEKSQDEAPPAKVENSEKEKESISKPEMVDKTDNSKSVVKTDTGEPSEKSHKEEKLDKVEKQESNKSEKSKRMSRWDTAEKFAQKESEKEKERGTARSERPERVAKIESDRSGSRGDKSEKMNRLQKTESDRSSSRDKPEKTDRLSKTESNRSSSRGDKSEKTEQLSKNESDRSSLQDKPEKDGLSKTESNRSRSRGDKSEKSDRLTKTESDRSSLRGDKPEKTDRVPRSESDRSNSRGDKPVRMERVTKTESDRSSSRGDKTERASKTDRSSSRGDKSEKMEQVSKAESERSNSRGDKSERMDRLSKPDSDRSRSRGDKSEKTDQLAKTESVRLSSRDKPEKTDRVTKAESDRSRSRGDKSEKTDRVTKPESDRSHSRGDKPEKTDRLSKTESDRSRSRGDKSEKTDRLAKTDSDRSHSRGDKSERPSRAEKGEPDEKKAGSRHGKSERSSKVEAGPASEKAAEPGPHPGPAPFNLSDEEPLRQRRPHSVERPPSARTISSDRESQPPAKKLSPRDVDANIKDCYIIIKPLDVKLLQPKGSTPQRHDEPAGLEEAIIPDRAPTPGTPQLEPAAADDGSSRSPSLETIEEEPLEQVLERLRKESSASSTPSDPTREIESQLALLEEMSSHLEKHPSSRDADMDEFELPELPPAGPPPATAAGSIRSPNGGGAGPPPLLLLDDNSVSTLVSADSASALSDAEPSGKRPRLDGAVPVSCVSSVPALSPSPSPSPTPMAVPAVASALARAAGGPTGSVSAGSTSTTDECDKDSVSSGEAEADAAARKHKSRKRKRRSEAPEHIAFDAHRGSILEVKSVGRHVLAACEDGSVYCYSLKSGKLKRQYSGHGAAVICLVVLEREGPGGEDPAPELLFTGCLDQKLRCFQFKLGTLVGDPINLGRGIQCMDENWGTIFLGTKTGEIAKFYTKSFKLNEDYLKCCRDSILALKATKEGARKILIVAARNEPVAIRDANSGLLMRVLGQNLPHTVYSLLLEASLVYCGTKTGKIPVFSFTSGEEVCKYNAGCGVVCMRIYNQLLFAGCYDGNIYIYNTQDRSLVTCIPGPGKMMLCLEVVKNRIIAGSKEKGLEAWPLPLEVKTCIKESKHR